MLFQDSQPTLQVRSLCSKLLYGLMNRNWKFHRPFGSQGRLPLILPSVVEEGAVDVVVEECAVDVVATLASEIVDALQNKI